MTKLMVAGFFVVCALIDLWLLAMVSSP